MDSLSSVGPGSNDTHHTPIYLDYAAATPLDVRVLAAMQPYLVEEFYNPSSSYLAGRAVKCAIEQARMRAAHWLGARPAEVIFTAGATESVNLAIHGVMRAFPQGQLLVAAIEHDAVLATARQYVSHTIPVDSHGIIDLVKLEQQITDTTVLLSVGLANSELGTIQPLRRVADLVAVIRVKRRANGNSLPLYIHSDASQGANYLDIHASRLGVDLLTLNAGKIYGPRQTGLLYVKAGTKLSPFLTGGGQELGLRAGTENTPAIVGFAAALDITQTDRKESSLKHQLLRDQLQHGLQTALPQMVVNGNPHKRLPGSLHVSFSGVDGERLVMQLDELGVQAATGSACAANKDTASHVLQAIGMSADLLQGSLRLTVGAATTPQQIRQAITAITQAVRAQLS